MKAILIAVVGVFTVAAGFSRPALADSARGANTDSDQYTLSGDSLTGIGNVTAEDHFTRFFSDRESPQQEVSRFNQSLSFTQGDVILQRAEESPTTNNALNADFNDGLEVLFDIRE